MSPTNWAALVVCLYTAGTGFSQTTETLAFSYNGNPVFIPNEDSGFTAVAEIFVPSPITIRDVTSRVVIDYPDVGDLEVELFSPAGTRTILLDNDCDGLRNINTTFDDVAGQKYDQFCPAEAGRGPFRADQPLANSRGELSTGWWTLAVRNNESDSRIGQIRSFSLTISGTPITRPTFSAALITNAASGEAGIIAPGQLVSIYGVALGPTEGRTFSGNSLPTTLGGTTVNINGTAAPILYTSSLRTDVQVPFNLTPGTVANLEVRTDSGGTSTSVPVEVVSAFAGLYTSQQSGRGQVAALNQNGSVNSSANPAERSSYVSLYLTGLGAVNPQATAGTPAPTSPLSTVTGNLAVLIGGVQAPITFAGLAPGLLGGTYQINVQVPSNIVPGPRSVIVIPQNGFPSQPGVFLWVR
jgi:uncharacterized protein (TIGR03437 family)